MSKAEKHREKRHDPRFELLEYAMVRSKKRSDTVRSVVIDVSLGGLQVRSRKPFPTGEIYSLSIGRVDAHPLSIEAEARYSVPIEETDLYSTGFRCLHKDNNGRIEWVDYVHAIFQAQGESLVG